MIYGPRTTQPRPYVEGTYSFFSIELLQDVLLRLLDQCEKIGLVFVYSY